MKIFLDDQYDEGLEYRSLPEGYVGAHSVNEVKKLVEDAESRGEEIELIDLDNDLGKYAEDGGEGICVIDWLRERETFYKLNVHSANLPAAQNMWRIIDKNWPK